MTTGKAMFSQFWILSEIFSHWFVHLSPEAEVVRGDSGCQPGCLFAQGLGKVLTGGSAALKYDHHMQGLFFWLWHCFQTLPWPSDTGLTCFSQEFGEILSSGISVLKASSLPGPFEACGMKLGLRGRFQQNPFKGFSSV